MPLTVQEQDAIRAALRRIDKLEAKIDAARKAAE
jgi:hypothetical protein